MKILVLLLAIVVSHTLRSQDRMEKNVSDYFKAYHTGNVQAMADLLSDSIYFHDETAEVLGSELLFTNKDTLILTLSKLFEGVADLSWRTSVEFTTGHLGVSSGMISYRNALSNDSSVVSYNVVSIVVLDHTARVVKHLEYANYAEVIRQMNK